MRLFRLNDDNNKPGRKVTVSVIRRRDGVETPMEVEVKAGEVVDGEEFAKWAPSVLLEVNKESAILPISPEHPFVVPMPNLRPGKQELIHNPNIPRSGTTTTTVAPPPPSFELRASMESKVIRKDSVPDQPVPAEVQAPKEAEPQPKPQDTPSANPRRSRVERRRVAGRT